MFCGKRGILFPQVSQNEVLGKIYPVNGNIQLLGNDHIEHPKCERVPQSRLQHRMEMLVAESVKIDPVSASEGIPHN